MSASNDRTVTVTFTPHEAAALLALFYHGRAKLTRLHRVALRRAVTELTDATRAELDKIKVFNVE
jgi:hypothetical protein